MENLNSEAELKPNVEVVENRSEDSIVPEAELKPTTKVVENRGDGSIGAVEKGMKNLILDAELKPIADVVEKRNEESIVISEKSLENPTSASPEVVKNSEVKKEKRMKNRDPETELKPIVQMLKNPKGKGKGKEERLRVRNLPKLESGAQSRIIGVFDLEHGFGLTCNCGHIMPESSGVPGYGDCFTIPESYYTKMNVHVFCPKCSSEIVMEDWNIISGATAYPPGAVKVNNAEVKWYWTPSTGGVYVCDINDL